MLVCLLTVLALILPLHVYGRAGVPFLFSQVENPRGNPNVRSIIRLGDGRMAFATLDGIELFDGSGFSIHEAVTGTPLPLPAYTGFHHLYLSHEDRYLWIKNWHELKCIDLDTETFVTDMPALMERLGAGRRTDDFFGDSSGRIWTLSGDTLHRAGSAADIILPSSGDNRVLDLATKGNTLYVFTESGKVYAYGISSGKPLYSTDVYPGSGTRDFSDTSLVVEGPDGFYQIRNGASGTLFRLNPSTRKWECLLESPLRLNTLAVDDSLAYISTNDGIMTVDLRTSQSEHKPFVRTSSGSLLASEISSIAIDGERGIWLGTLNRGILFHHPDAYRYVEIPKAKDALGGKTLPSSVFSENRDKSVTIAQPPNNLKVTLPQGHVMPVAADSRMVFAGEYGSGASFISSDGSVFFNEPDRYSVFIRNDSVGSATPVRPVFSSISVNGEQIAPLGSYDGNTILGKAVARTTSVTLLPHQNFLAINASLPQYAPGTQTFVYMLEGIDRNWQTARGTGLSGRELKTYYTALPPGEYIFKVKAASPADSPVATLAVTVLPHWWQTGWAIAAYILASILMLSIALWTYTSLTRKKIAREQREKYLLARIQNLIEETDRYKAESPETQPDATQPDGDGSTEERAEVRGLTLSEADRHFIEKAVEAVEKNLNTPGYSVAQLSRDLCMERTGLYRRLTALLDRSPSLFIRDIRLRNAARLLKENRLSITEIAEQTGFSSTSYMSKCFQERYGCRPSDFATSERTPTE